MDRYRLVEFSDGWAVVDGSRLGLVRVTVSTRDYAQGRKWVSAWNAADAAGLKPDAAPVPGSALDAGPL